MRQPSRREGLVRSHRGSGADAITCRYRHRCGTDHRRTLDAARVGVDPDHAVAVAGEGGDGDALADVGAEATSPFGQRPHEQRRVALSAVRDGASRLRWKPPAKASIVSSQDGMSATRPYSASVLRNSCRNIR